jgi:type I restriction enzyme S subunit
MEISHDYHHQTRLNGSADHSSCPPPPGWRRIRAGEALTLVNGRTFRSAEWKKTGLPIIRIQNLNDSSAPFNYYDGELPERFLVRDNELLFAWSGTPGTSFGAHIWRGGKAWLNQHIFKVLFDPSVFETRFLRLAINRNLAEYIASAHGAAGLAHITKARFEESELTCPPLAEQHRIVAEIEKQFTRLDAGLASLGRIQVALKRYRASALKAACEGRLTFTKAPVTLSPLRDLITDLGQGWSPKCELNRDPLPGEWAIIKTTAVQSMKYFDRESKPLPQTLNPRPGIEIKVGDFLMTRKGPRQRAGVTCLVRATRERLMVCDTVYRFRCRESSVNPAYLELALNSPQIVSEIDRLKSGINDSGVSLTHEKLGGVLLPIPPLAEQECIVAEVERRLSVIDEMEATVAANVKRAERLRQSILHRAFSGKLMDADVG